MSPKKVILLLQMVVGIAVLLTGCIGFEYKGEEFAPPTQSVRVFKDPAMVDNANYQVMGQAVVYGEYQSTTQDELMAKLVDKAKAYGADGVVVVFNMVRPRSENASIIRDGQLSLWGEDSADVSGWNTLNADFNGGYGSIRNNTAPTQIITYERYIGAKFLKLIPVEVEVKETVAIPAGQNEVVENINIETK